jgi:hypothetical protein
VGCRGDSRRYPHAVLALHTGTHGLSLDSPCFPRANLFEVDGHPQNKIKCNKLSIELQDKGVCTYLVQAEVRFVHCSSWNHDLWQRGSFGSRVNFQINNGDNELPTSIYRLFGLFLSPFWALLSVSLYQKPF